MPKWEYLTLFLEAKVSKDQKEALKRQFPNQNIGRYAPQAMIPELNQLGEDGWEVVHMEPVAKVGGNGDILFSAAEWSHHYFCVLKRPKADKPQVAPPPPATLPKQDDPIPPVNG